jgi:hypothetical protein
MKPPTIRELLEDPAYRKYVKVVPHLPDNLRHGNPWAVWALARNGRWRGGKFHTYRDAWNVVVKAVRNDQIEDVSIISLRWPFHQPLEARFPWNFEWCYRCRRPTTYEWCLSHHALKAAPVLTEDDPYRCFYCGVRRAYAPMGAQHVR